jgi:hypothetical protein
MKLDETILTLKIMLPAIDFIVTGSFVLAKYGLVPWDKVIDLDIILVRPENFTIELLNRFMKDNPAPSTAKLRTNPIPIIEETKEKVLKSSPFLQAIFMFDHIKVDIFIEPNFSEPTLLVENIKYTTIPHIIAAKKSYGRMKDWLQCRDMSKILFEQQEFVNLLNTNWKDSLKDNYE